VAFARIGLYSLHLPLSPHLPEEVATGGSLASTATSTQREGRHREREEKKNICLCWGVEGVERSDTVGYNESIVSLFTIN
jgi:hypothetical protein